MKASDVLVTAIAAKGTLRAVCVRSTTLVDDARRTHHTAPTASAALGRTLTAALLLGSNSIGEGQLSIQFLGNGPLGGIIADANGQGSVRGFVYQPDVHCPLKDGKLDVGGAVGEGTMMIIRNQPGCRHSHRSVSPIVSGEIGEDISHHLATSEQILSALSLGVFVETDDRVTSAGGFLVQAMPGVKSATLGHVEAAISRARPVSTMIFEGQSPFRILRNILKDFTPTLVGEMPVCFACRCTRERVQSIIVALGEKGIEEILLEEGRVVAKCDFCAALYDFSSDEARHLVVDGKK